MKLSKTLFQVHVLDTETNIEIPVGPAMDNQNALLGLAESINLGVIKGNIKNWRDAHVVQVTQAT